MNNKGKARKSPTYREEAQETLPLDITRKVFEFTTIDSPVLCRLHVQHNGIAFDSSTFRTAYLEQTTELRFGVRHGRRVCAQRHMPTLGNLLSFPAQHGQVSRSLVWKEPCSFLAL